MNREHEQQMRHGQDFEHLAGMPVFSADNKRIGTVDGVINPADRARERYMIVNSHAGTRTGDAAGDQLYVPESKVQVIDRDRVILETPQKALPADEWSVPPSGASRR